MITCLVRVTDINLVIDITDMVGSSFLPPFSLPSLSPSLLPSSFWYMLLSLCSLCTHVGAYRGQRWTSRALLYQSLPYPLGTAPH